MCGRVRESHLYHPCGPSPYPKVWASVETPSCIVGSWASLCHTACVVASPCPCTVVATLPCPWAYEVIVARAGVVELAAYAHSMPLHVPGTTAPPGGPPPTDVSGERAQPWPGGKSEGQNMVNPLLLFKTKTPNIFLMENTNANRNV